LALVVRQVASIQLAQMGLILLLLVAQPLLLQAVVEVRMVVERQAQVALVVVVDMVNLEVQAHQVRVLLVGQV
jgi:hypothetical protein